MNISSAARKRHFQEVPVEHAGKCTFVTQHKAAYNAFHCIDVTQIYNTTFVTTVILSAYEAGDFGYTEEER
jgi:hypothetical protein